MLQVGSELCQFYDVILHTNHLLRHANAVHCVSICVMCISTARIRGVVTQFRSSKIFQGSLAKRGHRQVGRRANLRLICGNGSLVIRPRSCSSPFNTFTQFAILVEVGSFSLPCDGIAYPHTSQRSDHSSVHHTSTDIYLHICANTRSLQHYVLIHLPWCSRADLSYALAASSGVSYVPR